MHCILNDLTGSVAEKSFNLFNSSNSAKYMVQGIDTKLKDKAIVATVPNLEEVVSKMKAIERHIF